MIRLLVVDDHAAVRAGLIGLLRREPGLVPLGAVGSVDEALREARSLEPQVALIDFQLPDGDGLTLCRELKLLPTPPRVVIYSAFARPALAVAATLAGADGLVDKGVEVDDLFDAIRAVGRGEQALPHLEPEMVARCTARLDPDDVSIFGMLMSGTARADVAAVLSSDEHTVEDRLRAMLGDLLSESATMRSPDDARAAAAPPPPRPPSALS
ncbi:MAG TPA: response regulator transcription factor [Solirubrobacteraceae bacterium]|nr:response regulator transcription factor [Solirubrobacteraceae bacterium]